MRHKRTRLLLIIISVGLIFFGANIVFGFIEFTNPKVNPVIGSILILALVYQVIKITKEQGIQ
ncbi:hypothetical protein [Sediminicola sp. 1XM1-17]|uniref:hypothetical protein n=1 Tax=Sediminicola sp. 1XM1-17 TaxID=3127702 RepID=UPI003077D4CF